MLRSRFIACLFVLSISVHSARSFDAIANPYPPVVSAGWSMAVDANGNVFLADGFGGARDFNPGVGADVRIAAGDADASFVRFNADGTYGWSQTFGGVDGFVYSRAVAVANNIVYVCGELQGLDIGIGGFGTGNALGTPDVFVVALHADTGAPVTTFGSNGFVQIGGGDYDGCAGIAVLGSYVYVCGHFSSPNFGIGAASSVSPIGDVSCFVAALDATTGAALATFGTGGVQIFGGAEGEFGNAIAAAGSAVYVTGQCSSDDAGIGHGGNIRQMTGSDCFVIALNSTSGAAYGSFGNGGIQFFGGEGLNDLGEGIAIAGNTLYVAGQIDGGHAGFGGTGTIGCTGETDAFLIAMNKNSGTPITSFGSGGVQTFGGTDYEFVRGVAANDATVYVVGDFLSTNAVFGSGGGHGATGGYDGYILAANGASGVPLATFGVNGFQKFGGTASDGCYTAAVLGSTLYVCGKFGSSNAGLGGPGNISSSGFSSYLLQLDAATGQFNHGTPVITSALTATGDVGIAFSYQITADLFPSSFTAGGLPGGLTCDGGTGVISGTPTAFGTFGVSIVARNGYGSDIKTLNLTINPPPDPPAIVSPLTSSTIINMPYSYEILGTHSPESYGVTGLPGGLSVNNQTGVISGTPTQLGNFSLQISATNRGGTGTATLELSIELPPVPVITSAASANATVGRPFSYQIQATSLPDEFDADDLPAGLSVSTTTGQIAGTPAETGTFNVTLYASNLGGTGTASLSITVVLPPIPVITSSLSAMGTAGQPFSYQIVASNFPTQYGISGSAPAWISVNQNNGVISGTPDTVGTISVTITATNPGGTGQASLSITINAAPVAITSALTATAVKGENFSYKITVTGTQPVTFTAAPLPAGLALNGDTISGTPQSAGAIDITLSAQNAVNRDEKVLRLTISHGSASNTAPEIISGPTASPVQILVGANVSFTVSASDANSDSLLFAWEFGDGATGAGASPSHAFSAAGIYSVRVTVSDGALSDSNTTLVAVNATEPAGGAGNVFAVTKVAIKFTFTGANKDSLSLSGTIPVKIGFRPVGKKITFTLGDLKRTFNLDVKGSGADAFGSVKLAGKLKDGVYLASPLKFAFALKNQSLFDKLKSLGFSNANITNALIEIDTGVTLGDASYLAKRTVKYSAKAGKSGSAK